MTRKKSEKPEIFIPEVLKSKEKRIKNLKIKEMIRREDKMKWEYRNGMNKKAKQTFRREMREKMDNV